MRGDEPGCRRLIVTDGLRYAVFFRSKDGFEEHPRAYLNLADMRSEYPAYGCRSQGCVPPHVKRLGWGASAGCWRAMTEHLQSGKPRLLFVCGRNQWRSPTVAKIYANDQRIEVRSAGFSPQMAL